MRSIKTEKQYFPITSKIFCGLWGLFATFRRILEIVVFFIPSMGLFNLLNHIKFEQVTFKIRLDYSKIISAGDKVALYGLKLNETIYWNELDHWDYSIPDRPTPPDYSLYTGVNLQGIFFIFWVIMALKFFSFLFAKMCISRDFRTRDDVFKKFLHVLMCTNISLPYKDWDIGQYTLEKYLERHWITTKEMAASFVVDLIFSIISMCPLWYTGWYW